jgi:predicted aspartyl protease
MPTFNWTYINPAPPSVPASQNLQQFGPVLPVEIHVPTAYSNVLISLNLPVPHPMSGFGLIDTGASGTAVDESVMMQLGVPPINVVPIKVMTPGGPTQQNTYPVMIAFPGTGLPPFEFSTVLGSQLQGQGIMALIGRDLLSQMLLVDNGRTGSISLSY